MCACVHKPMETRIMCQIMELDIQVVVSNNVGVGTRILVLCESSKNSYL